MVLLHGGSPKGAERIASAWVDSRKVPQIAFKPDWTRHAKAPPSDAMMPCSKSCPSGHCIPRQENLGDKARKLGIPVMKFGGGA